MKISVVIPTYQRPALLHRCLSALQQQDFNNDEFEVLVISDGPDPLTDNISMDFMDDKRFVFWEMSTRKGPAAARNFGWHKAKGTLIAFTDDDTIPDKQWLAGFWKEYHDEKEIAFTGRTVVPLSADPTDYERNTAGLETAEFVTANCCCTRSALQRTGGFDERFSMAWREDSDLQFKLISCGIPISKVPGAVVVHPVREAAWGISIKEQRKGIFNALLYKKFPTLYRQKIQAAPLWNYYLIVLSVLVLLIALLSGMAWLAILSFVSWLFLLTAFVYKRLRNTSRSPAHVMEMIGTSLVIPFISVYWQLYGAWKYRVLFL